MVSSPFNHIRQTGSFPQVGLHKFLKPLPSSLYKVLLDGFPCFSGCFSHLIHPKFGAFDA